MAYDFNELVKFITEQHKEIFPKATIETQMIKLAEEMQELRLATGRKHRDEERGDVLYVIVSLLRFPEIDEVAAALLDQFYERKSQRAKAHLRNILYMTGCKVLARYNKGVYKWVGNKYIRNKEVK